MDKNPRLIKLDRILRKTARENNAPIWNAVRKFIMRSRRRRVVVNISKINRYTSEGDMVVVPGKVLSCGNMNHKVTVAAFDYSEKAFKKLVSSNCKALFIEDLIKINPRGKGVKIIV